MHATGNNLAEKFRLFRVHVRWRLDARLRCEWNHYNFNSAADFLPLFNFKNSFYGRL